MTSKAKQPIFALWHIAIGLALLPRVFAADVYFNDFNGPLGTTYPEWTSGRYRNSANAARTAAASRQ